MCEQYPYVYCVFSVKRNSLWRRTNLIDKILSNTTSFLVYNLCWCGLSYKYLLHNNSQTLSCIIPEHSGRKLKHYHCQKQPISWTFLDAYRWSNVMESVDWMWLKHQELPSLNTWNWKVIRSARFFLWFISWSKSPSTHGII